MRLEFQQKLAERLQVDPIHHAPHLVGTPWLVALVIPPADQVRAALDQRQVQLGIEIAKCLIGELQRVLMHHGLDIG